MNIIKEKIPHVVFFTLAWDGVGWRVQLAFLLKPQNRNTTRSPTRAKTEQSVFFKTNSHKSTPYSPSWLVQPALCPYQSPVNCQSLIKLPVVLARMAWTRVNFCGQKHQRNRLESDFWLYVYSVLKPRKNLFKVYLFVLKNDIKKEIALVLENITISRLRFHNLEWIRLGLG